LGKFKELEKMEVVYDPNAQQAQYMPQQQQYDPQQQYNPQQQQMVPPQQQQQVPQQVPPQQYQQPVPQQMPQQQVPQQQYPQQVPQQAPQQTQQGGWPQQQTTQQGGWPQQQQNPGPPQGQGGSPVIKLQCMHKQMERMNLLMMDGYVNNVRVTNAPDGSVTRIGLLLAWEAYVFENGQQVFNPDGTPATRDVRFAMSAWGAVAQAMAQLPVGTPIRVWANANRWNASKQGEQANWQTDFRINRFEAL
jgi:hypothetical protein